MELYNRNAAGNQYDYDAVCGMLQDIDLYKDKGHKYGAKWLMGKMPINVLEWLLLFTGDGNAFDNIYLPEIKDKAFEDILKLTGDENEKKIYGFPPEEMEEDK